MRQTHAPFCGFSKKNCNEISPATVGNNNVKQ